MTKTKHKGFLIVSISARERMYDKGYKYRATGHGNKVYGKTLKETKKLIDNLVKRRKVFESKHNIRSDLRW
jgi:hypothetical protein